MSLTNALDAIAVWARSSCGREEKYLRDGAGRDRIVAATSNVVGGFFITDRMLRMFKSSRRPALIFNPIHTN